MAKLQAQCDQINIQRQVATQNAMFVAANTMINNQQAQPVVIVQQPVQRYPPQMQ